MTLSSYAAVPALDNARESQYQIRQSVITARSQCSATAIGPHALLTASHCELPTDELEIRYLGVATIVARIRDGRDHTIYLLKDAEFKTWAPVDLAVPTQGEDVYFFGNPADLQLIYRKGYLSGQMSYNDTTIMLYVMSDWNGDSGAAIYSVTTNRILGVVSCIIPISETLKFTGAFSFAFTKAQIEQAQKFGDAQ